ncbi:N-acetylglucosamine-1-phosphotransferase subunits alpha/beta-like isoform X2 [Mercenaria mercenaria]|uniref:N-acetylglucosamine-1-phosphotransferase subunits alpha/beta-like isoform X2 n=1 Tax=Mercenaria mercenaria TaxID=6596 RepID=UPI00234F5DC6|nr:N-acetylglucosamine-1-phosphotransferase subunits alpha/beta-like isoform X2 [Mercenaria mercenaria]
MENANWRKVVQKQIYDIISHRYGLLVVIVGAVLIVVSAFHFGESVMEWSTEKYAAVFNSFSDNLSGRSFRGRLCLPVPIDVVYTWVNGTDPDLIRNLQRVKLDMQDQLNTSREAQCVFSNCIPSSSIALDPLLPDNMTLTLLASNYPEFSSAKKMFTVTSPVDYKNYTIVGFSDMEQVSLVVNKTYVIEGRNTTVVRCYITPDATVQNGVLLTDQIFMSGFPHTLNAEELKLKLPEKYQGKIDKIEVNSEKGIAVLYVPVKEDFDTILAGANFTIDGKEPTLRAANMVWDLRDLSRDEDISASRFEDNEELRYSLRSLERFAPWIRHIYIITNGQLPYWLNLENPRISIITHDEIFLNHSHLPSFGSPAIESNVHRIPGLSDKFIYMNDDVMFGKEVWPDDFFTHSSGQKVYLTWPVPNCNEGCPSSWIKDGYCDKACNVSECEWDAGDCDGSNRNLHNQVGWAGSWGSDSSAYCHSGCANNWIADRYCDTACNVLECGFDAGDCGTDKYSHIHGMMLLPNQTLYSLPPGQYTGFFNLSYILSDKNTSLHNAYYDDNKVIRTVAVAKKFRVLTVVLHANMNKTSFNFTVEYGKVNQTKQLNFTLEVDTLPRKVEPLNITKSESGKNVSKETNATKTVTEEVVRFVDLPDNELKPYILHPSPTPDSSLLVKDMPSNMSDVPFPKHLKKQFIELEQELKNEELSETGYSIRLRSLWLAYQNYLKYNHTENESHKPIVHAKPIGGILVEKSRLKLARTGNVEGYKKSQERQADGHKKLPGELTVEHHQVQEDIIKPVRDFKVKDQVSKDQDKANVDVHNVDGAVLEEQKVRSKNQEEGVNLGPRRRLLNFNEEYINALDANSEVVDNTSFISAVDIQPDSVKLFPWEKGSLAELQKKKESQETFQPAAYQRRRLLDTFGDSLRHVNSLYNKAFGYTARKVPGHMPHMIDKNIMYELQARFPAEWEATSSHQIRHSKDMQFAFSYFYYLMGVKQNITAADVFDEMDTDKSKILSDREIRTLATRLYELPLDLATLSKLEFTFVNCSKKLPISEQKQPDATALETYYEKEMPQVTRNMFINCKEVADIVKSNFPPKNKYKHVEVDDSEIAFKMIKSNVSTVVGQLDDIRKKPKKFICLNDNIDHSLEQSRTVKAILADFYESLFPLQSQFELPRDYRNRFTHIDELREWRRYRDWLKFWTHIALVLLVVFTIASYFGDKIEAAQKKLSRRRSPNNSGSNDEREGQGHTGMETV